MKKNIKDFQSHNFIENDDIDYPVVCTKCGLFTWDTDTELQCTGRSKQRSKFRMILNILFK